MKRLTIVSALSAFLTIGAAHADSVNNFSQAAGDSAEASARVIAAGGQVAVGAVALPLAAAGTIVEGTGSAVGELANDLWDAANTPLEVDDDIVIAQGPPTLSAISQEIK